MNPIDSPGSEFDASLARLEDEKTAAPPDGAGFALRPSSSEWTSEPDTSAPRSTLTAAESGEGSAASVDATSEQEDANSQTYIRLLSQRLDDIVRNQIPAQKRRSDKIEQRIDGLEETLQGEIAELETGHKAGLTEVEARLNARMEALAAAFDNVETARAEAGKRALDAEAQAKHALTHHDAYRQAWQSAPLISRLRFVRELLPPEHGMQNMLKEAAALEELRRRGQDLETWLTNYPSLFADAMQSLVAGAAAADAALASAETNPVDILAAQTAVEARAALEATLKALGITWITPSPGDAVLAEQEVIGEESSQFGDGRVAQVRRRGFRIQGKIAVPAQVVRSIQAKAPPAAEAKEAALPAIESEAVGPAASPANAEEKIASPEPASAPAEISSDLPDWLRMLGQRTYGCDVPEVTELADRIVALKSLPRKIEGNMPDAEASALLASAIKPLLPLLGLRYAGGLPGIPESWGSVFLEVREPLEAWLLKTLDMRIVAPAACQT